MMRNDCLEISERFDVDDIRKIRDYNSFRYASMTAAEIVEDTKKGAKKVLQILESMKATSDE